MQTPPDADTSSDDPRLRPVTEGTHPLAMASLVTGIAGLFTASCLCFYPPVAPWLSGLFGLVASGLGAFGLWRVHAGAWHPSNRLQLRWGLGLGVASLLLAGAGLALLLNVGPSLGVNLPADGPPIAPAP